MHPRETLRTEGSTCTDCQVKLVFQVCHSNAGYYIGTMCQCGPYSRETGYFDTEREADKVLEAIKHGATEWFR